MNKKVLSRLRYGLHIVLSIPFLWVVYLTVSNQLGTDPAEKIVRELGFDGATGPLVTAHFAEVYFNATLGDADEAGWDAATLAAAAV